MAKIVFKKKGTKGLHKPTLAMIGEAGRVVEEYMAKGYNLTIRQLYYQLVAANIIPNKQTEYEKLDRNIATGRMVGLIDWDAIIDSLRIPYLPSDVEEPADAIAQAIKIYRL